MGLEREWILYSGPSDARQAGRKEGTAVRGDVIPLPCGIFIFRVTIGGKKDKCSGAPDMWRRNGALPICGWCLHLSHIIHPLLLAVKRHVRDNVDRGDVPRDDADALPSLPDPLAHLLTQASVPVAYDNSGIRGEMDRQWRAERGKMLSKSVTASEAF